VILFSVVRKITASRENRGELLGDEQWRTQKIFMGRGLVQDHMVVICIWCALFVTSQFDVMSMFPNQRFGEVC